MSDDSHTITISLDKIAKQMAAQQGMDREDWWADADHIEYSARIRNGKLTMEFIPVGHAKKRLSRD